MDDACESPRSGVRRIAGLLRQGNPGIMIYIQIIPGAGDAYDADAIASCLRALSDVVDAAAIYGGDADLIGEAIGRYVSRANPAVRT